MKLSKAMAVVLMASLMAACASGTHQQATALQPRLRLETAVAPAPFQEPPDTAVFPMDLAAPRFRWKGPPTGRWLVRVASPDRPEPLLLLASSNPWVPAPRDWGRIKALAPGQRLTLTILRIQGDAGIESNRTRFTISKDLLAARIIYQELPVPFKFAASHVRSFRWRAFDPASYRSPPTVLTGLPYCANCHAFSRDGATFGLDINYRGDQGGYILAPVTAKMELKKSHVISWNSHRKTQMPASRGLFAKISPSGNYVMASTNESPFLVRIDDPAYSQLFFPLSGQLAYYAKETQTIRTLHGADDPGFIQISPAWSPDEKTVAFARGRAAQKLWDVLGNKKFLDAGAGEDIHTLNQKHPMQFDLWHVPFNSGAGGEPAPLRGACANGKSNYFPRYTPDGRWIVFCQSDTGLVSQPTSRLMIIPAAGGTARPMRCNRQELNSYHSFAPNGRWMAFSSKPDTQRLTRVFLTHLDENGHSSPAVQLHRIGEPGFATILPEAVAFAGDGFSSAHLVEP